MKTKLKRLLLVLLAGIMIFAALACTDNTGTGEDPGGSGGGDITAPETINKSIVFADIRNALVNAGAELGSVTEGSTRSVTSEYSFIANGVNVTVTYAANYDTERREDSEIMLHIFDYTNQRSVVFVYYDGRDLYYDIGGERARYISFGAGSSFDFFYDLITSFDMDDVLYSEDFAANIESLSTFAESANITRLQLDETRETVNIRDINLDRLRGTVNDFITANIHDLVGDKLDALSSAFLGFDISDIGRLQIGLFTATEFLTVLERQGENYLNRSFRMVFEGTQNNNIDRYYFSVDYAAENEAVEIDIPRDLDPELRPEDYYDSETQGESYMTGTLELPFIDAEFDVELRSHIDTLDNSLNRIRFDVFLEHMYRDENNEIQTRREQMMSVYFLNGNLYIDAENLINTYFGGLSESGGFVDFGALGLPKVRIEGLDLSGEINSLLQAVVAMVSDSLDGIFSSSDTGTDTPAEEGIDWTTVFSKIESEGSVFRVRVDSEFLEAVMGESVTSIIGGIAEDMGINSEIIEKIAEMGLFEELSMLIEYDTAAGELTLTVYAADSVVMSLTLTLTEAGEGDVDSDGALIIEFPTASELLEFDAPVVPEIFRADFTATVSTQSAGGSDISAFLGLFAGDPTGANTPYTLSTAETVTLSGSVWDEGGKVYVDIAVSLGSVPYGRIRMTAADPDWAYVDNYSLGVGYRLSRSSVVDNCSSITGEEVSYDSVIEVLYEILGASRVSVEADHLAFAFTTNASDDSALSEFLGIDSLSGNATLSFGFDSPVYTDLNANDYPIPEVAVIDPETGDLVTAVEWESIYEAVWYTTASVRIGGTEIRMTLNYTDESTTLVTGVYEYRPRAALMGSNAGYTLYFTDTVNGTSVVDRLNRDAAVDPYNMVIDPSAETPFPATVSVVYDSGNVGALPYTLEYRDGTPFEYNNLNISNVMGGLAVNTYVLVLGKGSIAERSFEINLQILGRVIYVETPADGSPAYYGNIPIVARVTIDPYEYSQAPNVDPIRYREDDPATATDESGALALTFYGVQGGANQTIYVEDFDWNFDTANINYSGGTYYVTGKYQTLDIALEVTVEAKIVDYIQINDELRNRYTVDVLVSRTYDIPSATDEYNEVRIYFTTGHYRILGSESNYPYAVPDDVYFDGFYEGILSWNYPEATFTPVSGTPNPLNYGYANVTTANFGDSFAGEQSVSLTVLCPERTIGSRSGGFVQAVTEVRYDSDGNVAGTVTSGVSVSLAAFGEDGDTASDMFYFDPYSTLLSNTRLPDVVYVDVEYRGVVQRIGYPITWIAEGNIIDGEGNILNKFSDETILRVSGYIGDNPAERETLTMLILNRSGAYESLSFEGGMSDSIEVRYYDINNNLVDADYDEIAYVRYYLTGLNPYDKLVGTDEDGNAVYRLPSAVTLHFAASSGLSDATYATDWYFLRTTSSANYTGISAEDFVCSAAGGEFVFATETAGSGEILSQTIELYVVFDSVTPVANLIFGITGSYSYSESASGIPYQSIDTYSAESPDILRAVEEGLGLVEIGFRNADGSMSRSFVSADWADGILSAFAEALQSPYGSVLEGNPGSYTAFLTAENLFALTATIEAGTPLETTFTMHFDIGAKRLTAIAFNNFDPTVADMTLANDSGAVNIGDNMYIVTVERINALRTTALATPSQYAEYLLSNIQLTVNGDPIIVSGGLEYELVDDFDRIAYGIIASSGTTDTTVTIDVTVPKLQPGSCMQALTLRFVFTRETVTTDSLSVTEYVETFAENGTLLYETDRGYVIPEEYTVNYTSSGAVTYTGLVWYAANSVEDGDAVIEAGQRVDSIDRAFLKFTNMRYFMLYTVLPNETRIERRILFRPKDIGGTAYAAEAEGGFAVSSGVITITNVYDILGMLDDFEAYLPTSIRPYNTTYYTSDYQITFTLFDGWTPSAAFDDGSGSFDPALLRAAMTAKGYESDDPIATARIQGYNGEFQTIELYLVVAPLLNGRISFDGYDVTDNSFPFDPYASTANNGIFVLPGTITVTFDGGVSHTFAAGEFTYAMDGAVIDRVLYNNSAFVVGGKEYSSDTLPITVTLTDGTVITLSASFIDRSEFVGISYPNTSNEGAQNAYIANTYYIDPYDRQTFTLPLEARFTFATGTLDRAVSWTIPAGYEDAFVLGGNAVTYTGAEYAGASFAFEATLPGYHSGTKYAGEDIGFTMNVVVLNRTASAAESVFTLDDPFTAIVSDLNSALRDFYDLSSDETYEAYVKAGLTPVTPDILWLKSDGTALADDDLTPFGGFGYELTGSVGYGSGAERTAGQTIAGSVSAPAMTFVTIGTMVGTRFEALRDNIFEFNPYTLECAEDVYYVEFLVGGTRSIYVEFYPDGGTAAEEGDVRAAIGWDSAWGTSDPDGNRTYSVKLYNEYKENAYYTAGARSDGYTTPSVYRYVTRQVGIDWVDFGYGFGISGEAELVIDPLNPYIPLKATARGNITGSGNQDPENAENIGEVNIEWNSDSGYSIYDLPITGEVERTVRCTVTPESSNKGIASANFVVRVSYLDRTPERILTSENNYSSSPLENGFYTLMNVGTGSSGRNYRFTLDPTNTSVFTEDESRFNAYYTPSSGTMTASKYVLPATLRITFADDYPAGSVLETASARLGGEFVELIDIDWIISRDITLVGTATSGGAITAEPRRFAIRYQNAEGEWTTTETYDYFADDAVLLDLYELLLSTTERQVHHTDISEQYSDGGIYYQRATDHYIDPYNIEFPSEITIYFGNADDLGRTFTDVVWTYDEAFLERPDVVTGVDQNGDPVDQVLRYVAASMPVYGTTLTVRFPVRQRNIDTTIVTPGGEPSTIPLVGGTLYVLRGIPLIDQLPDRLYYQFEVDGEIEIASVPLAFDSNSIGNYNTDIVGNTYTISGSLGIDPGNITFTVIVVDPMLYTVGSGATGGMAYYYNGSFLHSALSIGVNRAGQYVPGPEETMLPERVIVDDSGTYWDIESIVYVLDDPSSPYAVVTASYEFISLNDSDRVFGDESGGRRMRISFNVPVITYDYTAIEDTEPGLTNGEESVTFELGTVITPYDMPLASNIGIIPLWSFEDVNTNRAGEYVARYSYKNAYGSTLTGEITVVVSKRALSADDVAWVTVDGVNFLDRVYTGSALDVTEYLVFSDNFLREDGSYGALEGYTVEYSIDDGRSWQSEQPTQVRLDGNPLYRVRIIINDSDDYNYTGSLEYRLTIERSTIDVDRIYFYTEEGALPDNIAEYVYNGSERIPSIGGLPEGAEIVREYAVYNAAAGENQNYQPTVRPVNAGTYAMRVSFAADQRNFILSENRTYFIIINIAPASIDPESVTIANRLEYNGAYRDAEVSGLPDGVTVSFAYRLNGQRVDRMFEAGTYTVDVTVTGNNYATLKLTERQVTVYARSVIVDIGTVSSEYLDEILPYASGIRVLYYDLDNGEYEAGLVGRELQQVTGVPSGAELGYVGVNFLSIFPGSGVMPDAGELTQLHMVGSYPMNFVSDIRTLSSNYIFTVVQGSYEIVASADGAVVIDNAEQLNARLESLRDGDTARWYLREGIYGDVTINVNASVSIIGSYRFTADGDTEIAVRIDSVNILRGSVLLDILSFKATPNGASVTAAAGTGLSVSRSEFIGSGTEHMATAIRAGSGFTGAVTVTETRISGYSNGIYMETGSAVVTDSVFDFNNVAVNVMSGTVTLNGNTFANMTERAVYIGLSDAVNPVIADNVFLSNVVAVESFVPLRNDIEAQNTFTQNATAIIIR